jgi:hypothetical protein
MTYSNRELRIVTVEGWPGGRRLIEGKAPNRCIHGRPLTAVPADTSTDRKVAAQSLCRLCSWEVARFGEVSGP